MSLKLVPWCEVFVDEDAVFSRVSFIEVFESALGTTHRVSTALAAEANNIGYRLCLAVDWASESVASFQVITCDWWSCVQFVVYDIYTFLLQVFTAHIFTYPWMRRFGRLEYCCIESTSSSRVSTLFSSCIFCRFYWIIVL